MATELDELRLKVAISCRILGMLDLVRGTTGHVSARVPNSEEMFVRCRGGDEYGLIFTGLHNIRRLDFDGKGPGLDSAHGAPNETPIHGEIYRHRPEAHAVVHAHPNYALLCGITKLEFRPVFGAYDPSALDIIQKGIPVFPRSVTVTTRELGADMLAAMGDRDVLLMQGHGITVHAPTVERATTLAIRFDKIAKIAWELAQAGLKAYDIPEQDQAEYRRVPGSERPRTGWAALEGVETWDWKMYTRMLQVNNIGLPDDAG